MHLSFQKTAILALGALSVFVDARATCGNTPPPGMLKRDAAPRPKPVLPTYGGSFSANAAKLMRRVLSAFPTDQEDQDTFMVDNVNNAVQIVPPAVDGNDINSAVFRPIADDSQAFSLGVQGLTGCTSLIVTSERGVYFAHFWETLSYETQDDFNTQVLDFVRNGAQANPDFQQSLTSHEDAFRDAPAAAALILYPVPDTDNQGNELNYEAFIGQLSSLVNELTGITPAVETYTPTDFAADDPMTAEGRGLWQFDPEARTDADPRRGYRYIHEYTDEGIHFF